jgi:transposase InsO family protein
MSRRGNCYGNARAEAFFSTLKIELVYRHDFGRRERRASGRSSPSDQFATDSSISWL